MRVLYDHQIFDAQKFGGVSRYFAELIRSASSEFQPLIHLKHTSNEYLREVFAEAGIKIKQSQNYAHFLPSLNFNQKKKLFKAWEIVSGKSNLLESKKALSRSEYDVFHPTYYSAYHLKYSSKKPFVLTVYDMIHEIFPQYFANTATSEAKKLAVSRADKIIAISHSAKRDLIEYFGTDADKIEVIYLANSLKPVIDVPLESIQLPENYILYVGSRDIYKNFTGFVEAASQILREDRQLKLVIAGGYSGKNQFAENEQKLFKTLDIEKQIIHMSISDAVLARLYRHARCFVFPSIYEGFGIPVLEAFACGCPVVLANTSSLPEVGGEAALYINPADAQSIYKAVKEAVYSEEIRQRLKAAGFEQLKKFSWQKTCRETQALYSSLVRA